MALNELEWEKRVQDILEYLYAKNYEKAVAGVIDLDLWARQNYLGGAPPTTPPRAPAFGQAKPRGIYLRK